MKYDLPPTIKVGYTTYHVRPWDGEHQPVEHWGQFDHPRATIGICNTNASTQVVETLLHETLHAIWYAYNIGTDEEERLVSTLAKGLTSMVVDNPDLLGWITGMLKSTIEVIQ